MDAAEPLPPSRIYLPFEAGPYRMAMGLAAVTPADWLDIDQAYHTQRALRELLLRSAPESAPVVASIAHSPAADAAGRAILAHLARYHGAHFSLAHGRFENHLTGRAWPLEGQDEPLVLAGRQIQEDLCVLEPIEGVFHLTAAMVCFPSRWNLADKIGQPMAAIHGPVPDYQSALQAPVERFFHALKPGRIVQRFNWSVHDDAQLHQPAAIRSSEQVTTADAGARLYLRVERQTLSRIAGHDGILFTIRTYLNPLADIVALPDAAAQLAAGLRALPPEVTAYRAIGPFKESLLAYLDEHTGP